MSLTIKFREMADEESNVDIARFTSDRESLHIEFAKIISINTETNEIEELEICSTHTLPIENAKDTLFDLFRVLIEHEKEYNTGYGVTLPDNKESD